MKVPIMYKSSDRFNAGTDVIYDDESKLQHAPFIYASVTAKDNGDSGDDEEGEEFMIIKNDGTSLDKTWAEISTALSEGKFPVIYLDFDDSDGGIINYIDGIGVVDGTYSVYAHAVEGGTVTSLLFTADSDSSTLTFVDNNP